VVFGLVGVAALNYVAHDSLPHVFVLFVDHRFGWDARSVGLALMAVGVTSTLVSAFAVGPIVARLGEQRALFFGLAMGALGFALYGLAPTGSWIFAAIAVTGLWAVWGAAAQSLMSQRVAASEQGSLQGALAGLRAACQVVTPGLFNGVFAVAVSAPTGRAWPGAPFVLSSLLVVVSMFVAGRTLPGRPAVVAPGPAVWRS
jgi:DHA1 family tetracycline resistance protein-like MFS transporter